MQFRPAQPADAANLWTIDQQCFPPPTAFSLAEIRSPLRPAARGWNSICEIDGAVAGFILSARNRGLGHVVTIDVLPRHRRTGIGRRFMQDAEVHFRRQGSTGMRLEVAVNNAPALRFYLQLGYRLVRVLPGYYEPDLDGLLLHKPLSISPALSL